MKKEYKRSAVYRWDLFKEDPNDKKLTYIGETQNLARRIRGYLKPGPTQETNKRLNALFTDFIKQGYKIGLEIIHFKEISINNKSYNMEILDDPHSRKMIENFLVFSIG